MVGLLPGASGMTPPPNAAAGAPAMGGAMPSTLDAMPEPGGEASNVSPEEQAEYDRFMDRAFRLIYDAKVFPGLLERLRATPDPVEGLASVTVMVVTRLQDSARQQGVAISPDVLYHGGLEIMEDLAATAEKARVHAYTDKEMEAALYQALDLYRQTESASGGIDQQAAAQDWDALVQADQQGRLHEALPGIGKGGGAPQPSSEQAPTKRGLMPPNAGGMR
jgi:hypothetical protein